VKSILCALLFAATVQAGQLSGSTAQGLSRTGYLMVGVYRWIDHNQELRDIDPCSVGIGATCNYCLPEQGATYYAVIITRYSQIVYKSDPMELIKGDCEGNKRRVESAIAHDKLVRTWLHERMIAGCDK
jgi:hypothetical protein